MLPWALSLRFKDRESWCSKLKENKSAIYRERLFVIFRSWNFLCGLQGCLFILKGISVSKHKQLLRLDERLQPNPVARRFNKLYLQMSFFSYLLLSVWCLKHNKESFISLQKFIVKDNVHLEVKSSTRLFKFDILTGIHSYTQFKKIKISMVV